jgi:ribosome-associated protein
MLKRAFKGLPYCKVLPIELRRGGTSYTIDTIHELKEKHYVGKGDQLYLIMGQDLVSRFATWKDVAGLIKETLPLVARRKDSSFIQDKMLARWLKGGLHDTPCFEISSTEIRNRIKKKLYCGHLLNNLVYNFMKNKIPVRDMQLLEFICQKLYDKKGFNIMTLDLREFATLSDYFIICEGNVEKHVQSLARELLETMSEQGRSPIHIEGQRQGDWIVLDFADIVIHLFIPEMREKYCLEHLWKDASIIDVPIHVLR